jgi:hypothetical protein
VGAEPRSEAPPATEGRAFATVAGVAAAYGLVLGVGNGGWQVAVESGQVLAGLVRYPPTNPFGVYHLKLWTLSTQLSAVLLRLGLSEIAASLALSGVLGLVSFLALALVVYALTRARALALLVPLFVHMVPAPQIGVAYPIWIVGGPHTYGALGLAFMLLVIALLACDCWRAGLLLLGLAPAVHASLGAWLWLLAAAAIVTDGGSRTAARRHALSFVTGAGLAAVSLAVQASYWRSIPPPAEDPGPYFEAFIREWDGHRAPVDLHAPGLALSLGAGLVALLWLRAFPNEVPVPGRLLLRVMAAGSLLGVPLIALTFVDPARVPHAVLSLMPARMMNLNVLAALPALLALLGGSRSRWRPLVAAALVLALSLGARSRYATLVQDGAGMTLPVVPLERLTALAFASVLLVALAAWERRDPSQSSRWLLVPLVLMGTAPLAAAALVVFHPPQLHDRTNNRLFAELAKGEGLVATAGELELIQLRTRRPVLIDGGGLDSLPYARDTAPEMARILRDVYSIDFFHPPLEARHRAMIPATHNRAVWESRPHDDWKDLGRKYGLRQLLVPRDWDLDLPALSGNKELLVYDIPE